MDSNRRVEASALVDRALRLQLAEDGGDLSEVEECLIRAIELDEDNIEALQEIAHLYDAVLPDADKAKRYAVKCREKALNIVSEMDSILADAG